MSLKETSGLTECMKGTNWYMVATEDTLTWTMENAGRIVEFTG